MGNDLDVIWTLCDKDNSPIMLEGKSVALYLSNSFSRTQLQNFSIEKNEVHWTFLGKMQRQPGYYKLTIVINDGQVGMITMDACNFVNLVSCSSMAGSNDDTNISTESIQVHSTIEVGGVIKAESLLETICPIDFNNDFTNDFTTGF